MMDPYRTAAELLIDPLVRPNFLVRAWRGLFGHLVYGGAKTCGHCRYWSPVITKSKRRTWSDTFSVYYHKKVKEPKEKGDCKLIFSHDGQEKRPDETCERFNARRKYKHRIR